MTLNMRFSGTEGALRVSAFGLELELAQVEGRVEVALSKGADGFTALELRDVSDDKPVGIDNVTDGVVVDESIDVVADASDVLGEPDVPDGVVVDDVAPRASTFDVSEVDWDAEFSSRLDALRGILKVSMAYRVLLAVSRGSWEPVTDSATSDVGKDDAVANESTSDTSEADGGTELFNSLVALRRELSKEQGVPPYIIFHDKTLWDMVRALPEDLNALYKIGGVGEKKLERYGNLFLEAIREYRGATSAG